MPSIVWKFFEKGSDTVKCKRCGHAFPFKPGSSTSSMLRHIQNNHQLEYANEVEKNPRPGKRKYPFCVKRGVDESDEVIVQQSTASTSNPTPKEAEEKANDSKSGLHTFKQETLPASITKNVPYKPTSQKKQKIDELVLDLITDDIQPLSVVENRAFRRLLHELDPKYEIVSRKTLTNKLLPKRYNKEKALLINKLADAQSVSLTTDQWTSKANEGYTTITGHYIDDKWKMHSPVLLTRSKPQRHTALNLAAELEEAFNEFSIQEKVTAVVTDNAANIKCAVSRLGQIEDGQACFAHTLNLCVKHAIKDDIQTQEAVKSVREIVTFFRQSNNAMDDLREEHRIKETKFYKLKKDVETRWNSIYSMIESFMKQRIQVSTVLTKHNKAGLTPGQVKTIEEALVVLKPFLDVTQEISSEKYTSISKVIPIVKILTKFLNSKQSVLAANLKEQINEYFADVEAEKFTVYSTFLDPRFKEIMLSKKAKQTVKKEIKDIIESSATLIPEKEKEKEKKKDEEEKEEAHFWADFDNQREKEMSQQAGKSAIDVELSRYTESPLCDRKKDPLIWWRENEMNFPNLAKQARTYLAIPATSVPSERVFSKAGEIVSAKRASIKSKNVDMILFLNKIKVQ